MLLAKLKTFKKKRAISQKIEEIGKTQKRLSFLLWCSKNYNYLNKKQKEFYDNYFFMIPKYKRDLFKLKKELGELKSSQPLKV